MTVVEVDVVVERQQRLAERGRMGGQPRADPELDAEGLIGCDLVDVQDQSFVEHRQVRRLAHCLHELDEVEVDAVPHVDAPAHLLRERSTLPLGR